MNNLLTPFDMERKFYTTATAKMSYQAYEAAREAARNWSRTAPRGCNLTEYRDALEDAEIQAAKEIFPIVGKGATILYFSDRRAVTITGVELTKKGQPKAVEVTFNKVVCKDYYAGDYEVLPELDTRMGTRRFTLRRNGRWYEEGQETDYYSVRLMLNYHEHYIDPHF